MYCNQFLGGPPANPRQSYMAELAIQSVRKMMHADWLPSRAISFRTNRLVLAEKFPSWFEEKQTQFNYILQKIYNNRLRKPKLNVLNDNFKQKTRWIDAKKKAKVISKNKQVNPSRSLTNTKLIINKKPNNKFPY